MRRTVILLLTSLFLFACNEKSKHRQRKDSFYSDKGDFDMSRFPLIKPYEISTAIPSHDWIIASLDKSEVLGTIPGTKHINVIDSVIFAHCKNTIVDGQPVSEAWFIVIPKRHLFRGFENRSAFLNYLSSIKIKEPKMYNVSEVFQYFDRKDTLDWQELNNTY